MIIKKSWERFRRPWRTPRQSSFNGAGQDHPTYLDTYTGWFLFGVVPLYVVRETEPIQKLRDTM